MHAADAGKQGQIGIMNGLKYVSLMQAFDMHGQWVWDNCRPHIYEYNILCCYL